MAADRISTPSAAPALLLAAAVAATFAVPAAHAQPADSAATEARRSFNVPAGPLDQALVRFGRQAGAQIAVNADLTAGLASPGVSGSHTVADALRQLLAGTGLQAARDAGGEYTLRRLAQAPAAPAASTPRAAPAEGGTLPTVRVTAQLPDDGSTEGTGSYTTRSMSTATRLPLSIRETPQSVSVITSQRIEDQGLTQLPDVVQQIPGVTMAQAGNQGSDSSQIFARGFEVENYQVDGVSHLHSNYTNIFQTNDMVLYDRVEVVRGATGLMNGIGTPSATINLVRKKPTAATQGYVRAEAGSWNRLRVEADASGPLNEAGTLRGRGVLAWQGNDSYIDRLEEKKKIVYGVLEADLAPGTLLTTGITWQHHRSDGHSRGGLPLFNSDGTRAEWKRSNSAAATWAYSDRENLAFFTALEHRLAGEWKVKATYSHDRTTFDEQLGYAAGGAPDPATGAGVSLYAGRWGGPPTQNSFDVQVGGPFMLGGRRHDLVLGATVSRTKQDAEAYHLWYILPVPDIRDWDGSTPARPDNSPVGDFNYTEQTTSAWATARFKPTDALSIILGARTTTWKDRSYNRNYATGATTDDRRAWSDQVTPYAGIVLDLNPQWSVYGSYTDIFKPQNNRDPAGRPLDPLLGKSYEIGTKAELFDRRLNFAAAIYQVHQDNLAVEIPGVLAPDGSQAYRAESGTKTRGIELELGGQVARNWQASVAFARNVTQDAGGQPLNTEVPRNTFKLFSSYRIPTIGHGLTIGGGVRWQNRSYADFTWLAGAPRVTQDAYALADLMVRYDITPQLAATFNAYNLFDKSYHTSPSSAYYGEPCSFRVGLVHRF